MMPVRTALEDGVCQLAACWDDLYFSFFPIRIAAQLKKYKESSPLEDGAEGANASSEKCFDTGPQNGDFPALTPESLKLDQFFVALAVYSVIFTIPFCVAFTFLGPNFRILLYLVWGIIACAGGSLLLYTYGAITCHTGATMLLVTICLAHDVSMYLSGGISSPVTAASPAVFTQVFICFKVGVCV